MWSEKRDLNPKLLINFYLTLLIKKKEKKGGIRWFFLNSGEDG
jgi:hypothetical protein